MIRDEEEYLKPKVLYKVKVKKWGVIKNEWNI